MVHDQFYFFYVIVTCGCSKTTVNQQPRPEAPPRTSERALDQSPSDLWSMCVYLKGETCSQRGLTPQRSVPTKRPDLTKGSVFIGLRWGVRPLSKRTWTLVRAYPHYGSAALVMPNKKAAAPVFGSGGPSAVPADIMSTGTRDYQPEEVPVEG
jgi:hypothetical protein